MLNLERGIDATELYHNFYQPFLSSSSSPLPTSFWNIFPGMLGHIASLDKRKKHLTLHGNFKRSHVNRLNPPLVDEINRNKLTSPAVRDTMRERWNIQIFNCFPPVLSWKLTKWDHTVRYGPGWSIRVKMKEKNPITALNHTRRTCYVISRICYG